MAIDTECSGKLRELLRGHGFTVFDRSCVGIPLIGNCIDNLLMVLAILSPSVARVVRHVCWRQLNEIQTHQITAISVFSCLVVGADQFECDGLPSGFESHLF